MMFVLDRFTKTTDRMAEEGIDSQRRSIAHMRKGDRFTKTIDRVAWGGALVCFGKAIAPVSA
ncbi:MAG: hypothetical protein NT070_08450 [Cyanobacteria bacterium]|nr:hypothetical protein [Cyanobacteriota bacterium]